MFTRIKSSVIKVVAGPSFCSMGPDSEELKTFCENFHNRSVIQLFEYWLSKCPPGDIPLRADMQPVEMKSILSRLVIWDYIPEIEANRVRLAGTGLGEALPYDPSGQLNTDVLPEEWNKAMRETGANFYSERRPLYFLLSLAPFERDHVFFEFLSVPLRRDGAEANMGIGLFDRVANQEAA